MRSISLVEAAAWMGAEVRGDATEFGVGVFSDSRHPLQRGLFVALKGDRFDGHSYVEEVLAQGASGAIVSAEWVAASRVRVPEGKALLLVDDPLAGLQRMAASYRGEFQVPVIGITGSNGKTSTKEFAAAALGGEEVLSTEGNLNNHIGVPLTLMRLDPSHRGAVVEMGMNHAGELAPLVLMAQPTCGIVTCVGVAHIEHLGSREAIAAEKIVVAEGVPLGGVAVLNAEDEFFTWMRNRLEGMGRRVIGVGVAADVEFAEREVTTAGSKFYLQAGPKAGGWAVDVEIQVPGRHMAMNAALGLVGAVMCGAEPQGAAERVAFVRAAKGRLRCVNIAGVEVLDDSYNANPDSMVAALRVLSGRGRGRKVAALGRMGELGAHAQAGHMRVGREAAGCGVDWLVAVGGEEAGWMASTARAEGVARVDHFPNTTIAADALRGELRPGDTLLVKGSRSAHMEAVIAGLEP
jgi:UDP-N-acetylmuramoyl-tripeptide--D-alanyl-D-alanine ligase